MSFLNMSDNLRNDQSVYHPKNKNSTSINSLYQQFYNINCNKSKNSYSYPRPKINTLTNRDVSNCTDECIRNKQLSGEYEMFRRTNNKTKNIFCYEYNKYTESIEFIIIRKYQVHSFSITVMCQKCKELKSWSITNFFHEIFPRHYFDLKLSRCYMNEFTDKKGIKHNIKNEINILIND